MPHANAAFYILKKIRSTRKTIAAYITRMPKLNPNALKAESLFSSI
jgi:hypothetical protein